MKMKLYPLNIIDSNMKKLGFKRTNESLFDWMNFNKGDQFLYLNLESSNFNFYPTLDSKRLIWSKTKNKEEQIIIKSFLKAIYIDMESTNE